MKRIAQSPAIYLLTTSLLVSLTLGGCATHQEPLVRENVDLRQTIHEAVPASWRDAAEAGEEVSPLAVSPELREFLDSRIRGTADDRDKMLALTRAIVDRDGVGLTYKANATYTAIESFESGEGNCLGFSNLLVASARELGLNASYELVSHSMRWDKVDDVLVATLHVRVTSLSSGRRMVFDFYPQPIEPGFSTRTLTDREALAHHLNNLAAEAMQDGDNARAYALLYGAIDAAPHTAFIWSNLGLLLSRQNLEQMAENAYNEALTLAPDTPSAMSNLQTLYFQQGRLDEAKELRRQLAAYRDRNPYHHFALGEEAFEKADYKQAIRHFKDAIDRKNKEPEFWMLLAESYEKVGNARAASRAIRKAESIKDAKVASYKIDDPPTKLGTRIKR